MATSSSRAYSSGELITDDLINDILLRLPVKSLLRFKSVSKIWFSLISNPSFVKSRLHRTIASSEADQPLIIHYIEEDEEDEEGEEVKTTISLLRPDCLEIKADLKFPYSEGEFPFVPDCILVGSSRGIVCVCIALSDISPGQDLLSEFAKRETNTYLWNPATRQSKLILPPTLGNNIRRVALGFGFDQIGDDFKVVRVVWPPFTAEVYSTNRNVWRKVESDPIDFPYDDDFDVCVHGFLCCVGVYGMMAFDLNTEVLTCIIDLPVRTSNARIVDFNDSVAVIIYKQNKVKDNIRLWTLDDEACLRGDGEASWTPKFDIGLNMQVDSVLGYFNQDVFLLMSEDDYSYLYNTDKHEARRVPFAFHMHQIHKYRESLVSIPGSKQVNWNSHKHYN